MAAVFISYLKHSYPEHLFNQINLFLRSNLKILMD